MWHFGGNKAAATTIKFKYNKIPALVFVTQRFSRRQNKKAGVLSLN